MNFRGAWCVGPGDAVAFTAFYPNMLFGPGMGVNVSAGMMARAEWVATLRDGRSRDERWSSAMPAAMRALFGKR
jgi:hypothetical protein